jgi:hypothetical protein
MGTPLAGDLSPELDAAAIDVLVLDVPRYSKVVPYLK